MAIKGAGIACFFDDFVKILNEILRNKFNEFLRNQWFKPDSAARKKA